MMADSDSIGAKTDPSALTTQQTLREVGMLKELMETKFDAVDVRQDAADAAAKLFHEDLVRVPTDVDKAVLSLKELIFAEIQKTCVKSSERFARIDTVFEGHSLAIDAALKSQQKASQDLIDIIRSEVEKLAAVSSERFTRIDTQFIERDKRTEQLSLADKTAVSAALQAAKEAVAAQNTSNSIAIAKSESSTVESIRQLQALFNTANAAMNDKINDVKSRLDKGEGRVIATTEVRTDNRASFGIIISAAVAAVVVISAIVSVVAFAMSNRAQVPVYAPAANFPLPPSPQNGPR